MLIICGAKTLKLNSVKVLHLTTFLWSKTGDWVVKYSWIIKLVKSSVIIHYTQHNTTKTQKQSTTQHNTKQHNKIVQHNTTTSNTTKYYTTQQNSLQVGIRWNYCSYFVLIQFLSLLIHKSLKAINLHRNEYKTLLNNLINAQNGLKLWLINIQP